LWHLHIGTGFAASAKSWAELLPVFMRFISTLLSLSLVFTYMHF